MTALTPQEKIQQYEQQYTHDELIALPGPEKRASRARSAARSAV